MTDVARVAGVSHQTVSRVINEHPNVSQSTRLRVLAAIAELGFRPNRAARSLVTARCGTCPARRSGPTLRAGWTAGAGRSRPAAPRCPDDRGRLVSGVRIPGGPHARACRR